MDKNPSLNGVYAGKYGILVVQSNGPNVAILPVGILILRDDGSVAVQKHEFGRTFVCDVEVHARSTTDAFSIKLKQRTGDRRVITLSRTVSWPTYTESSAEWQSKGLGVRPMIMYDGLLNVLAHLVTRSV